MPLSEKVNTPDQILSSEEIDLLFGNIEEVKQCSKQLIQRLNNEVFPTPAGNNIGKVFISMVIIIIYNNFVVKTKYRDLPYLTHFYHMF